MDPEQQINIQSREFSMFLPRFSLSLVSSCWLCLLQSSQHVVLHSVLCVYFEKKASTLKLRVEWCGERGFWIFFVFILLHRRLVCRHSKTRTISQITNEITDYQVARGSGCCVLCGVARAMTTKKKLNEANKFIIGRNYCAILFNFCFVLPV